MKKHITWEIIPQHLPFIHRRCPKCNQSKHYYCSGKFRMNSQKNSVDVWLIYRCEHCDNTWNATVLSRVTTGTIDRELFDRFTSNDNATAMEYAFDRNFLSMNRIEIDYDRLDYALKGKDANLDSILDGTDPVEITIFSRYMLDLSVSSVLRSRFGISNSRLKDMVEKQYIRLLPDCPFKKAKVKNKITIIIDPLGGQ